MRDQRQFLGVPLRSATSTLAQESRAIKLPPPQTSAVIAQNVYLFCAAMNLGVVVRGLVERKKLAPAMALRQDQPIVMAQTVGYA